MSVCGVLVGQGMYMMMQSFAGKNSAANAHDFGPRRQHKASQCVRRAACENGAKLLSFSSSALEQDPADPGGHE